MSDHPQNYGSQPVPPSNPGGTPPHQGGYGGSYPNPPDSSGGYGSATPPGVGGYGAGIPQQGGSTYGSPAGSGGTYGSGSTYGSSAGSDFGPPPGAAGGYGPPPGDAGGYGTPPAGPGGYGTPPGQEPKTGTNGFAIAGLICGLAAPCGAGLLSVIFGIIALSQIKKTGQKGRGLALGGLIATGAWVLLIVIITVVAIVLGANSENSDPSPQTGDTAIEDPDGGSQTDPDTDTDPEDTDVYSLSVGDCLIGLTGTEFSSLPVVPCSEPHEGEVYALFDVSVDGFLYPGEDVILDEAQQGCTDRLRDYSQTAYDDNNVDIFYLYPSEGTWLTGDREVVCVTYYLDGPRTGSITD